MAGTPLHYRRPSPRPGNSLFHVEVPPGTTALTVQAKYSASQAFSIWFAQDPTGRELPFNPYGSELYAFDPEPVQGGVPQPPLHTPVPRVGQLRMTNHKPPPRRAEGPTPHWTPP